MRVRLLEDAMPDQQQPGDEERERDVRHDEERLPVEPRHVPQAGGEQDEIARLRPRRIQSGPDVGRRVLLREQRRGDGVGVQGELPPPHQDQPEHGDGDG